MKSVPLFLVLSLLNLIPLNAQELHFGIKGGLNYNNIGELYHIGTKNGGGNNVIPIEDTYYTAKKENSFHYGAYLSVLYKKFFFRPEINFTSLKNSYPLSQKLSYWTSKKVDIPLLFGYNIYKPISLFAGPVFSKISNMQLDGVEYPIVFKKSVINVQAGILFDFGRFGIDVRYEHNLKPTKFQRIDIVRAVYGTNVAHLQEYNQSQIIISLDINLFKINTNERQRIGRKSWRGSSSNCSN
jgi:hypothetical protein